MSNSKLEVMFKETKSLACNFQGCKYALQISINYKEGKIEKFFKLTRKLYYLREKRHIELIRHRSKNCHQIVK